MKSRWGWIYICIGLGLFLPHPLLHAGLRVEDPTGVLNAVDPLIAVDFQSAFQQGDQAEANENLCDYTCDGSEGACTEHCVPEHFTHRVTSCGVDSADIETFSTKGTQTAIWTRSTFEGLKKSRLRAIFQVGDYGSLPIISQILGPRDSVIIEQWYPVKRKLSSGQEISSVEVEILIRFHETDNSEPILIPMTLSLGIGLPFVAQLIEFRYYDRTLTPLYVLNSYLR